MSHWQAKLPGHQHSPPRPTHDDVTDAGQTHNHGGLTHIDRMPNEALMEVFKLLQLKDVPALARTSSRFRSLTQYTLEPVLKDLLGGSETISPSLMSFLLLGTTTEVKRHTIHVPFRQALQLAARRMTKMYISLEYASKQESEALFELLESFLRVCFPSVSV